MAAHKDLHSGQYSKNQDKQIREYDTRVEESRGLAAEIVYYMDNLLWLLERFPDGRYRDVIGLCKAAKLGITYETDTDGNVKLDKEGNPIKIIEEDSIADQDYSLNAGRYVGVVIEDDGMTEAEFRETMLGLNVEFETLNAETKRLEEQIVGNMKALFGE